MTTHHVLLSLEVETNDGTDEHASTLAADWCDLANDLVANRQTVDDVTNCNVQPHVVEPSAPTVVNHIDHRSLDKAATAFGNTLMNRFQPQLLRVLPRDFTGELATVLPHVDALLAASRKRVAIEVMARLGFDWDDKEWLMVLTHQDSSRG